MRKLNIITLAFVGLLCAMPNMSSGQKLEWDVEGKKNIIGSGVNVFFLSPGFDIVELKLDAVAQIQYSRILNRKSMLELGLYRHAFKYEFRYNLDEPNPGIETSKPKNSETQLSIGLKRFRTKKLSFAPIGAYYKFGLNINILKATTPSVMYVKDPKKNLPGEDMSQSTVGAYFGLGRDFLIRDNFVVGLGLRMDIVRYREPTIDYPASPFSEYVFYRGWAISEYRLAYLF